MIAEILAEDEAAGAIPALTLAPALSERATGLSQAALWRRLERWMSHRWGVRVVTWRIKGPGAWEPRLTPAVITASEIWNPTTADWTPVTLEPGPMGYSLDDGPYRITADVGETDPPPEEVQEAFRRLAEYVAEAEIGYAFGARGAGSVSERVGDLSAAVRRPTNWMALAMQNSGAADLLRQHRRAA